MSDTENQPPMLTATPDLSIPDSLPDRLPDVFAKWFANMRWKTKGRSNQKEPGVDKSSQEHSKTPRKSQEQTGLDNHS